MLRLKYVSILETTEAGFRYEIGEFPGCYGEGATRKEAVERTQKSLHEHAERVLSVGEKLPGPRDAGVVMQKYFERTGVRTNHYLPFVLRPESLVSGS